MKKQCKDCNNTFTIEDGEIDFYKSKNLQLPNRCKSCRDKRKSNNTNSNQNNNQNSNSNNDKFKQNLILIITFVVFTISSIFYNEISIDNDIPSTSQSISLEFRTQENLTEHFNKHGSTLGHSTASSYLQGANNVINSSNSLKRQQSDGDTAYFLESTKEFVVVSTDNYIRTYFKPTDGINYFNRQ